MWSPPTWCQHTQWRPAPTSNLSSACSSTTNSEFISQGVGGGERAGSEFISQAGGGVGGGAGGRRERGKGVRDRGADWGGGGGGGRGIIGVDLNQPGANTHSGGQPEQATYLLHAVQQQTVSPSARGEEGAGGEGVRGWEMMGVGGIGVNLDWRRASTHCGG